MAPGNNERHPNHTGTIPKTKVRNNCNVPQEAVTPTRRDMSTNLVTTSLDWVPVSEYNPRVNSNQTRKPANNISDHDLSDLDNSVSFESGFGRFVPVRPQPRVLPLNTQNRGGQLEHNDDSASTSVSGYTYHPYSHSMTNGLIPPHSNHAAAAVMIVNPTTPNSVSGNMSQPFNASGSLSRNNLARNLNAARNHFEGCSNSNSSNNNSTPSTVRMVNKSVNLMNNMYDSAQSSSSNVNENTGHRVSAHTLGDAMVAACPDAAAVERRLGQIREYIRVTSSLVDTMRNSEDEAYIEHTKEEYDELVEMVMKLKESENKLEKILTEKPENQEVLIDIEIEEQSTPQIEEIIEETKDVPTETQNVDSESKEEPHSSNPIIQNENVDNINETFAKKVTNLENEILNRNIQMSYNAVQGENCNNVSKSSIEDVLNESQNLRNPEHIIDNIDDKVERKMEIIDRESAIHEESDKDIIDKDLLKETLMQNIVSCSEKLSLIEDYKSRNVELTNNVNQEVIVRPISVQSNGSGYSDNELWQNEIKNKMEISQQRLAALQQQQKRLLKYQADAKQQLAERNLARQSQELQPSTSHDNMTGLNQTFGNNFHNANRMYAANQIGVATTLPQSSEVIHHQGMSQPNTSGGSIASNTDHDSHGNQEDRFTRESIVTNNEGAVGGHDSDGEVDEGLLSERGRELTMKLRELQLKKQHMENLVSEFQKLQMSTHLGVNASSNNTYSSSGEDSVDDEPAQKCNKSNGNIKNEDPFKLMEIKAIKTALQKTKDLMRSVENYEEEHLAGGAHDENFQISSHSNINDTKSEGGNSVGAWSNDGSVCRVRNTLPQRHKFTNEQHSQQQSHDANMASLQELAQQLRMETEKIMDERARLKHIISNKEFVRKHKKVNEEVRAGPSGAGPAELRQRELRAILAEKQKQLEALLNKEKALVSAVETQQNNEDSRAASLINHSYNSEQDEPDCRSEQILMDTQNTRENEIYRGNGDNLYGDMTHNALPPHLASTYCSDSDSVSRNKSNQRNRVRRRQPQERHFDDNPAQQVNVNHEPRIETPTNMNIPMAQIGENGGNNAPFNHNLAPPCWGDTKLNQDIRTNQFTQNSHSQTMERLLNTPQLSYPPTLPFNMMMPYGAVGGCGCGCGLWGACCWQQLGMQQREIQQLRERLTHIEERWRVETASHTLNNQVPPGNRANNYWDNFRSYSRQNLLSTSSKTNADGRLSAGPAHNPHPLAERSHNALHAAAAAPPEARARAGPGSSPDSLAAERRASSKLPAKNSAGARSRARAGDAAAEVPNPNLASASRENRDKAASKLFSLMRENVYSEVTALIGVNESHPEFLIQLFRELRLMSSEPLRRRVLQSIRNIFSQYSSLAENRDSETSPNDDVGLENVSNAPTEPIASSRSHESNSTSVPNVGSSSVRMDENNIIHFLLARNEEICTPELLEMLASQVSNVPVEGRQTHGSNKRLYEFLSKYEGIRLRDVYTEILENLPALISMSTECEVPQTGTHSETSILQDVAGSLNLFSSSDPQLHQINSCPYELWPGHVHMDIEAEGLHDENISNGGRINQDGKVDLVNCADMHNGDLAEADQTCHSDPGDPSNARDDHAYNAEILPDEVDTEETTPTEAEAEWLGLDRVPTRLHMEESPENQKD